MKKKPWQMSRQEWDNQGQPTLGYERKKTAPWMRTASAEQKAIKEFQLVAGTGRGGTISPYDYNPMMYDYINRDNTFAKKQQGGHRFLSKLDLTPQLKRQGAIGGNEDAREAIIFGRKMGFKDNDIAFYLRRNYGKPRRKR